MKRGKLWSIIGGVFFLLFLVAVIAVLIQVAQRGEIHNFGFVVTPIFLFPWGLLVALTALSGRFRLALVARTFFMTLASWIACGALFYCIALLPISTYGTRYVALQFLLPPCGAAAAAAALAWFQVTAWFNESTSSEKRFALWPFVGASAIIGLLSIELWLAASTYIPFVCRWQARYPAMTLAALYGPIAIIITGVFATKLASRQVPL
jgi:hypothetical protein